jgi:hypothetical protein
MPCAKRAIPVPLSDRSSTSFTHSKTALIRVKRLEIDDSLRIQKLALYQAASQCQRSIDNFWKRLQKLQPRLQPNGTNSKLKDGWAKIKWAVCKKEDLQNFRAEIRGHTSSIDILLLIVNMEATTIQSDRQSQQQKSLAGMVQGFLSQVMGKLGAIADSVSQTLQQGIK